MSNPNPASDLSLLKNLISGKLESLYSGAYEDMDLAAGTIAEQLAEAYVAGDQDSADEMVEQLELLGEVQRLRLSAEVVSAFRDAMRFAVGVLFSFLPKPQ
jgi:hypothetical protein